MQLANMLPLEEAQVRLAACGQLHIAVRALPTEAREFDLSFAAGLDILLVCLLPPPALARFTLELLGPFFDSSLPQFVQGVDNSATLAVTEIALPVQGIHIPSADFTSLETRQTWGLSEWLI